MKYLIAGLGNIGPEYHETRHNIGFMILDFLSGKTEAPFSSCRYGDKTEFKHKGRHFFLLKPSTYMNRSGRAVHYWMTHERVELENLLVVVDDIALPLGTLRMKASGGSGGHNGLTHIAEMLGNESFARLRFGIGAEYPKGFQSQYVLEKWLPEERALINPRIEIAGEMILSFGLQGAGRTMTLFNNK
ncbi:MAG TPA: aminoacyl-tRNA hydrolase [Bacteroidales bacterium]|nr:aminoacyl-tRNA hydrolase [Bacteroidales bacterium]